MRFRAIVNHYHLLADGGEVFVALENLTNANMRF
jgi:hypothetical protein